MTLVLDGLREVASPAECAELDDLERKVAELDDLEEYWQVWLRTLFPDHFAHEFADHHAELWRWVWAIEEGERPAPFVAVWNRGGAKSTSAEAACVALGARGRRRYGLYVCETQDQADDHVSNVASLLESDAVEEFYPALAARMVGKYGNPRGWRRNRLRTAAGFTLDAIGLDTAARGVKLEDARPDFLVIDDIDGEHDGVKLAAKKVKTLTKALIPAGADDLAILAIQNLVHPDSVFAQLVDGRADFLAGRIVSGGGPVPAIRDLVTEQRDGRYVIVGGTPTWGGMDLKRCQEELDDMGLTAFLSECQHHVEPPPGGMFDHLVFARCTWDQVPDLERIVVWVDPAVTDTDQSDSMGIQADGIAEGKVYRLWSWEARTSPLDALCRAIRKAIELCAEAVGVETDQGGDTWASVYREACEVVGREYDERGEDRPRMPEMRYDKAGAGHGPKAHRAGQMLADYERGAFVHVIGTHDVLERALRRFPKTKPFDLTDASYWSWRDLVPHRTSRKLRYRSAA